MATKIVTKNSSTASAVPTTGDLVQGELAVNVADKRLFTEDNGGAIVELGTNPSTIDINAGTIDGTAIGASSASTGAFTTLTSTGIDVTGTATMDGLTVQTAQGDISIPNGTSSFNFARAGTNYIRATDASGAFSFITGANDFATQRLNIANNGDISFYEDTGTTPKFFWDSSAESLGIGTSSPTAKATIEDGDFARLDLNLSNATGTTIADVRGLVEGTEKWRIGKTGSSSDDFVINVTGTEGMRIDSSGKVLLNTANSPTTTKAIISSDYSATGTTNTGLTITGRQGGNWWNNGIHALGASGLVFSTGTSGTNGADATNERMRIDANGNLLVGTTSTTLYNATSGGGVMLDPNGPTTIARSAFPALYINRTTSDGTLVEFRKDGTTVGSIGTFAGDLTIGDDDVGLRFDTGTGLIPWDLGANSTGGAATNGAIDIGAASARFKDLYLSGGVYLGGTGAANKLDDYEEGTWTPSFHFDVGGSGVSYGARSGAYLKVGRLVTVTYSITVSGLSSSDYFLRLSLPFEGIGQNQAIRVKQYNSALSDWALSVGGANPVFYASNAVNDYARGDDVNSRQITGSYTYTATA